MYGKSRVQPLVAAIEARDHYTGVWQDDDDDIVNTNARIPIFEVDGGMNRAGVTEKQFEVSRDNGLASEYTAG